MTQDIDFQLETAFQRAEDWVVKSEGGREMNRNKWKYYSMLTYSTLKKKKVWSDKEYYIWGQGKEKWNSAKGRNQGRKAVFLIPDFLILSVESALWAVVKELTTTSFAFLLKPSTMTSPYTHQHPSSPRAGPTRAAGAPPPAHSAAFVGAGALPSGGAGLGRAPLPHSGARCPDTSSPEGFSRDEDGDYEESERAVEKAAHLLRVHRGPFKNSLLSLGHAVM